MSLDPHAKRFLDVLAATNPPSAINLTVAERRLAVGQLMKFSGPEQPVALAETRSIPGPATTLPVRVYTPAGSGSALLAGLVYFHGGGLVAGTVDSHDAIARALANAGGCRVVSVGYRLAPEDVFPAAVDDACAALAYIGERAESFGIDAARLGVCGDSAGATLAAVGCQFAARAGCPKLSLQLLICPILDYAGLTDSRRQLSSGYFVDQSTLDHDLLHYLPAGTDPRDPRVSPLRADDLQGLPRTSIHTAEFDPLRDEGKAYADRLTLVGTPVTYTCHPGMIHLFYGMAAVIPYARTALQQMGAEIRAALSQTLDSCEPVKAELCR